VESEATRVIQALQSSDCKKHLVFELPNATAKSLERKIRTWKPHVVHFIGHADVGVIGGYIVTEAGTGKDERVYGEDFGRWLKESGVQLAVISGCKSAGLAGSVGQALCDAGVPVVIGMREPVPDWSAMAFSRAFYASLALGETIETAVEEGRSAMPEWSLPVLMCDSVEPNFAPRHNIAVDPRPFVGRVKEREAVLTYLTRREHPVSALAIHAMGGMGKTRLAQQVGLDAVRHFPAGVWWVDCESLTDADQLWGAIGTAVGAEGGRSSVVEALGGLRCLLILDCLERLAETHGLISQLRSALPEAQFLITTRILPEEATQYSLEPMAETAKERMALFEVAVRQMLPDFRVNNKNRKLCGQILTMLQGVPLAIFLAAGRLRHMTLEELHERLQRSRLGVVGPDGRVGRHASLRIVIEDSFGLLSEASRELAIRLSIFAGGFRLADARRVLPDVIEVEDGVFTLCDHSMLSSLGVGAGTRYKALDTVREFLDEASNELDLSSDRALFFDWALGRAEEMHALTVSGKLPEGFEILKMEIGNFRSALRVGTDLDRFRYLLLRPFLEAGYLSEFSEMAAAVDCSDDQRRAEVRGLQAICARRQGRYEDELRLWEEKIEACRSLGDVEGVVETSIDLALTYSRRGAWSKCELILNEYADDLDSWDQSLKASHCSLRCIALQQTGDSLRASQVANQVRGIIPNLPHPNLFALINLSEYYRLADKPALASECAVEGIEYALAIGKYQAVGKSSHYLCLAVLAQGRMELAQRALDLGSAALALAAPNAKREMELVCPTGLTLPRIKRKGLEAQLRQMAESLIAELGREETR